MSATHVQVGPGDILSARYVLHEQLGLGGMGAVYRATDLRTAGPVAVKVVHTVLAGEGDYTERLRREAQLAASLVSPRIVRVMDFARDATTGVTYLVQEYVAGETIEARLRTIGRFAPEEAVRIGVEVARALEAAHAAGIIHRDLKPSNIMLVEGQVKVLDFGIARAAGDVRLTAPGHYLGTPLYSAPELAEGDADGRSDIYSVGLILYELLSGRVPFDGTAPLALLRQHRTLSPPPLPDDVPQLLQTVVMRCLAKRPADRFPDAQQLREALRLPSASEPPAGEPGGLGHTAPDAQRSATADPLPRRSATRTRTQHDTDHSSGATTVPPRHGHGRRGLAVWSGLIATMLLLLGGTVGVLRTCASGREPLLAESAATELPASIFPSPTSSASHTTSPPALAIISGLKIYRSGEDFLAGREPVAEVVSGGEVLACYGYTGAGAETALTTIVLVQDSSQPLAATSEAFVPVRPEGVQCNPLMGAASLAPGHYAVMVQDRGEERARGELSVLPLPLTPTPTPVPTVVAPPPTSQPARTAPATPRISGGSAQSAPPATAAPAPATPRIGGGSFQTVPPATAPPAPVTPIPRPR